MLNSVCAKYKRSTKVNSNTLENVEQKKKAELREKLEKNHELKKCCVTIYFIFSKACDSLKRPSTSTAFNTKNKRLWIKIMEFKQLTVTLIKKRKFLLRGTNLSSQ